MEQPVTKKLKTTSTTSTTLMPLTICTHSGSFHADEALGVHLLRQIPKFSDATLIRSRNPEDWEKSDIVIDVGAKYDGVKFFDHHQREFEGYFDENYETKLSSAGLVYKHYGKELIATRYSNLSDEDVEILFQKMYRDFIESVDANDNGVNNYPTDIKPKFHDKNFTLASAVANMNPGALQETVTDATYDAKFLEASKFMGMIFDNLLTNYAENWLPAKNFVYQAFDKRFEIHESGKIVLFDSFLPWKEHLYELERLNNCVGEILYVLFPDSSSNWRISAVPVTAASFESRKKLPEPWRGLRDDELSEKTGVEGCVFIHAAGFIGGAKTKESVLKLASLAVV